MRKSSLEELRGQVSAGEYAVDADKLADDMLSKFALIGRVRTLLVADEEEGAARRGPARRRRESRPGPSESLRRATNAFRKNSPR